MRQYKIKRSALDIKFSWWIRNRDDWTCVRCEKKYNKHESSSTQRLDCSHYFGRGKLNTRFDVDNCDSLCKYHCHRIWSSDDREAYRTFKIKQLSENGFNMLILRSNRRNESDLKLIDIWLRGEIKKLEDK